MPDLLAGTVVNALDTPPTVSNTQVGSFTHNATTYGIDADTGTYVDCGVAFTAPTSGRVMVLWRAQVDHDGTALGFTAVSFVIRTGSTVGSGTVVLAADDNRAVIMAGTDVMQMGSSHLVTGLTPGDSYNVRLEHKVGAGVGTTERRGVVVAPQP